VKPTLAEPAHGPLCGRISLLPELQPPNSNQRPHRPIASSVLSPCRHVSRCITHRAAALDVRCPPRGHPQCLLDLRSRRRRKGEGRPGPVQGIRRTHPRYLFCWICYLQGRICCLRYLEHIGQRWRTYGQTGWQDTMFVHHPSDSGTRNWRSTVAIERRHRFRDAIYQRLTSDVYSYDPPYDLLLQGCFRDEQDCHQGEANEPSVSLPKRLLSMGTQWS
jgi:hypothetical protein